jgi:hypothetical protein
MSKLINTQKSFVEKVRAEWGTREGTNLEKLVLILNGSKNKPILLSEITKAIYGKLDPANRNKVKMVLVGLNMTIEGYSLPYQHVALQGRGEEATLTLATKGRAAPKAAKKPAKEAAAKVKTETVKA